MKNVVKRLLPCAAAWVCVACGGGAETAPPVPLAAPPVMSSTSATAQAAEPVVFRACCDSGEAGKAR